MTQGLIGKLVFYLFHCPIIFALSVSISFLLKLKQRGAGAEKNSCMRAISKGEEHCNTTIFYAPRYIVPRVIHTFSVPAFKGLITSHSRTKASVDVCHVTSAGLRVEG
jgi:hypothetical protein